MFDGLLVVLFSGKFSCSCWMWFCWLRIFSISDVSRKITMFSVMNIVACFSENWLSESIKLCLGFLDVIFNAVSIGINNFSWFIWTLLGSFCEFNNWSGVIVTVCTKFIERNLRVKLKSSEALGLKLLSLSLCLNSSFILSFLFSHGDGPWVNSRLRGVTKSYMTWHLSVVSVVKVLNRCTEHHLSELIKLILIELLVILNTISVFIDDSSWFVLQSLLNKTVWHHSSEVNLMVRNVNHVLIFG